MAIVKPTVKKPLVRGYSKSVIDTGPTLTEQAHKNETDMNFILRDYARIGLIRHSRENEGKYDDISVQDYQSAMFVVAEANSMFEELPSSIRKRFKNDPTQFLEFVQNPNNLSEMKELGMLRGNDGIDISGTSVNVPTQADYQAMVTKLATDVIAESNKKLNPDTTTQ